MSDYERWTIYPLLLLTLGIVLKDKMLRPVADAVVCHKLSVVDDEGNTLVAMGPTERHAGGLEILTAGGKALIVMGPDDEGKRGVMFTKTDDGYPLLDMVAHGNAGAIVVHDAQGANIIGGPRGQVRFVPQPHPANENENPREKKGPPPRAEQPKKAPPQPAKSENPMLRP